MDTFTRVPLPRPSRPILNTPPSNAARSRIPSKPIDLVFEISSRPMPRPLSFTSSVMHESDSFKLTLTSVAPAWRMTLVKVSWKMRKKVVLKLESGKGSCTLACTSHLMPVRF